MIEKNKIQQSLEDVRKAYRLLYLYQERVQDLAKFIGEYYKLDIRKLWSKFGKSHKNGKKVKKLDESSWDWLNMYLFEYHFQGKCDEKAFNTDVFNFSIFIQSDSGYHDANLSSSQKRKIPKYAPVEDSKTFVHLVLGVNKWAGDGFRWPDQYFKEQGKKDTEHTREFRDDKGFILSYRFPMKDMWDTTSTESCLKKFSDYCATHGVLLTKEGLLKRE